MEPSSIVLIMGGIATLLGALVAAYRGLTGDKFKRKTEESENILAGYTGQIKAMREELKEARDAHREEVIAVRKAHAEEMFRINAQHIAEVQRVNQLHEEDREEWAKEKAELRSEIEMLKSQLVALLARIDNTPLPRRKDKP